MTSASWWSRIGGDASAYAGWGRDKGHGTELAATVDAVRAGAPAPIPFAEVVDGMRATFAIRRSLATGMPVEVPDA